MILLFIDAHAQVSQVLLMSLYEYERQVLRIAFCRRKPSGTPGIFGVSGNLRENPVAGW